jgi:hypothetical protein
MRLKAHFGTATSVTALQDLAKVIVMITPATPRMTMTLIAAIALPIAALAAATPQSALEELLAAEHRSRAKESIAVSGQHEPSVPIQRAGAAGDIVSGQAGHHQVGREIELRLCFEELKRIGAVGGEGGFVAGKPQDPIHEDPDRRFIVHDEHSIRSVTGSKRWHLREPIVALDR